MTKKEEDDLLHTAEGRGKMVAARRIGLHRLGECSSRRVFQRLRRRRRLGKRQRARGMGAPAVVRWISSTAARSIPTGSNSAAAVHAARFRRRHGLELEGEVWSGRVRAVGLSGATRPRRSGPNGAVRASVRPRQRFWAPPVGNALNRAKLHVQCNLQHFTESVVAFAND